MKNKSKSISNNHLKFHKDEKDKLGVSIMEGLEIDETKNNKE